MGAITVSVVSTLVTLDADQATVTVSVTNREPGPQRVVLGLYAVPGAVGQTEAPPAAARTGADAAAATPSGGPVDPGSWTAVDRPLREIAPGATEQYAVSFDRTAAPTGTHHLKVIAYPADRAPEEYSEQGRVLQVVVPATPEPAPRARPWWLYALIAVLVLAVAAVAFVLLRPRGPEEVAIPDVTGLTQAQARERLSSAGLTGVVSTATVDAPGTARDVAVGTEPAVGEPVPSDEDILLVLATGRVEVPDLTGVRDDDAEQVIAELELEPAFDGGRPGTVVGQDRTGLVPVDATVTLTIDPDVDDFEPPCLPWPQCILPDLPLREFPDRVFEPELGF